MRPPRFSVVIPCYNVAATIAETIASVSAQSAPDLEIVAVDNNSTDATASVLARLAEGETRLRIVRETTQGLSAARNCGIRTAKGRFIAFLDGDDLFDPDYLKAHGSNLDGDGDAGVSYSRIRLVDVAGRPTGSVTRPPMTGLTAAALLRANPCTSMVVVRREVIDRVGGFDEGLRRVEDQEWLFRVAHAGVGLRGIDRVLASYRIMPGGLSHDIPAMLAAHAQMLERAARLDPDLVAREGRLSRAGMLRYCARRTIDFGASAEAARGYLWRMFLAAPDLLLREPLPTLKVAAAVLTPDFMSRLTRTRVALKTEAAP
jgi:glycosyltransferase involved in cell wall biosynthesis